MSKLGCLLALTVLAAIPAAAQTAIPDVRGTWKGESESLVLGGGNPHHTGTQANEPSVISRNGTIFLADDEGYTHGILLAPNRMELCYLHVSSVSRIASCAELTKQ
jgi:hypothetical protein